MHLSVQGSVTVNVNPNELLGEIGTHPCDTPNCAFMSVMFVFSHFSNRAFNHKEDVSLTLLEFPPGDASRLRSQISLLSYPTSKWLICGHSSPDQRRAACHRGVSSENK